MSTRASARLYIARGWETVPIPPDRNGPTEKGWQHLRIGLDAVDQHFSNAANIGVQLGPVSGELVDVDLDCPEALALADDVLVAVDPAGFVSGFSGDAQIDVAREAMLHMDTAPDEIVTDDSGSSLASGGPVRSLFQTYSLALRLILRCAWSVRAPGLIQLVTDSTW
jgi:hypothetical protein